MREPVIELADVSFSYNGTPVLENISLSVPEHDFLSIVGPNGGGKTTILKLVLGLVKPRKGRVSVFGLPPEKARTRIGYMPQSAALDKLFPVSVLDVVLMGRLGTGASFGLYTRKDRQAAEEALRQVELFDARNRPFADLSGGQHQRVLIARALVSHPDLLLLDEPTANVDVAVETEFYEFLRGLSQSMTIVLVTHDLGFVSKYVKNVACVNRRLLCHPTCDISGEVISEIYGAKVHMVRHDEHTGKEWCRD
ncbi:MAG TPA: metal ABC transporter ATP-binding protein [Deltaproteobacteria bacterium]|jgi:zinc transport system ATP-binding protein|nr:metal ABC transporter ATP-binding protein [Deltaproteobacteria bacterium]HOI06072.1 metal ABC transporter ATP-binding protein [Deltaproteobacteria bacterium]